MGKTAVPADRIDGTAPLAEVAIDHAAQTKEVRMRRIDVGAGVIALAMVCASGALADDSATVRIHGRSAGLGVGTSWGDGILTYDGYDYPFTITELSLADVGATGFTGSGTVHNLNGAEDFNGNFATFGAGLTLAGGGSIVRCGTSTV
jgi:hypothetical protein